MKDSPKKHYIALSLKGPGDYHADGETLCLTERVVNIGETADCDVRFRQQGAEPVYYASVIRNGDSGTWRIVRRSMAAAIRIEGKGDIGFAAQLADGDRLLFGDHPASITVHPRYDDRYNEPPAGRSRTWLAAAVAAVLAGVAAVLLLTRPADNALTEGDVQAFEQSVCMVRVDSVEQVLCIRGGGEQLVRAKSVADEIITGTAFITTDGTLVTARHCVEYWIGTNLNLTTRLSDMSEDDIVRWAVETETFNQLQPDGSDSAMVLRSHFSVYDFLGEKVLSCSSTDPKVHIDKEHDGLFLLADFTGDYYWRTIRPYFTDERMTMGDMLRIDSTGLKGSIEVAAEDDISSAEPGSRVMICGYPMTGSADKRMLVAAGAVKVKPEPRKRNIMFESNINHGFSGGPLLMKTRRGIAAIGVVSRVDSVSSGIYKYAVPLVNSGTAE